MEVHFLDLGTIEYDEGWPLAAAGVSTPSDPNPTSPRRKVAIIATLIDHPAAGPVLFVTGAAPNVSELWPPPVQQAFAITHFGDENRLDAGTDQRDGTRDRDGTRGRLTDPGSRRRHIESAEVPAGAPPSP